MFRKRSIIVLLVGANLLLLGLLIVGTYTPSAAWAQSRGAPGDFITVTAKPAGQNYDVIYLLDTRGKKMHAFYPSNRQQRTYGYGKFVDLKAEFPE